MILDFFHISKEKITELLERAIEQKEISKYELEVNFDDYVLDITIYPTNSSGSFKLHYKFERLKNNITRAVIKDPTTMPERTSPASERLRAERATP